MKHTIPKIPTKTTPSIPLFGILFQYSNGNVETATKPTNVDSQNSINNTSEWE